MKQQQRKMHEAQSVLRLHGSLELECGLGVGLCAIKRREKGMPSR